MAAPTVALSARIRCLARRFTTTSAKTPRKCRSRSWTSPAISLPRWLTLARRAEAKAEWEVAVAARVAAKAARVVLLAIRALRAVKAAAKAVSLAARAALA